MTRPLTNWAGNFRFSAREVLQPGSVAELQAAVHDREHVKVLGTGHSFNGIADCTGDHCSTELLNRIVSLTVLARL